MPAALLSRWGLEPVVVDDDESSSPASADEEDPDDEVTGRTLWDCTQVLWDLVADPDPHNAFTVRGKHVIELGGGTGALSVGLARAGAASVACTDLPCHLARIERTVNSNTRTSGSCCDDSGSRTGGAGGDGEVVAGADKPVAPSPPVTVQGLRWGDEGDLARVLARRKDLRTGTNVGSSSSCNGDAPTAETTLDGSPAPEALLAADTATQDACPGFDVIVLSEVLYWPALDLLQEDTREPLRRTLLGLSKPGTKAILIYKERWPHREKEFLASCERSFEVMSIPARQLPLPASTTEDAGTSAIRAVLMTRSSSPVN